MKSRFVPWIIAATGALCLTAFGCQTGPGTSSSSNWVVCETPADCADVAGAVDCQEGYCVDEAGRRIEVDGSGGTGGGSATGGFASDGGGGVPMGGATTGSGGDPLNLGGQGSAGSGGTAGASCEDADPFAACTVDDDCIAAPRIIDCCGTTRLTGVAVDREEAFETWALECSLRYPACGCSSPLHPLTDDGRWLTTGEAAVGCVSGQCRTAVGQRPCGESTCEAGEICLLATTVTGPSETREFSCVENPCVAEPLDCTCGEAACSLGDGRSRLCTPLQEEADILCEDQAQ